MRPVLIVAVLLCACPAAASAKYLHVADAQQVAQRASSSWRFPDDSASTIDSCRRGAINTHYVYCHWTEVLDGMTATSWIVVHRNRRGYTAHDSLWRLHYRRSAP